MILLKNDEVIDFLTSPPTDFSALKMLQIETDLLRTITSTADELSRRTNIDELATWNPQNRGFSEFLAILGCNTHFKTELCRNRSR